MVLDLKKYLKNREIDYKNLESDLKLDLIPKVEIPIYGDNIPLPFLYELFFSLLIAILVVILFLPRYADLNIGYQYILLISIFGFIFLYYFKKKLILFINNIKELHPLIIDNDKIIIPKELINKKNNYIIYFDDFERVNLYYNNDEDGYVSMNQQLFKYSYNKLYHEDYAGIRNYTMIEFENNENKKIKIPISFDYEKLIYYLKKKNKVINKIHTNYLGLEVYLVFIFLFIFMIIGIFLF